ncbi:MAG: hypothetical protein K2K17_10860 [Lachnospiraceae bacterium]|nr:hypothetical protein [Lachnospiraceae bacterium]
MAMRDEIRQQNRKWKTMTPEEKKKYFLTYYKWHVIIFCVILIIVGTLIRDIIRGSREQLLYVMTINNSEQYMYYGLMDEYAQYAGIDTDEYQLHWDTDNILIENDTDYTSIATIQKFASYSEDGMLDALILPEEDVAYFEKEEYFIVDLKEFLDDELYAAVEDRLYMYHCTTLDEDICIGFYLDQEDRFYEIGLYGKGESVVLIPLSNSSRLEYLYLFLKYMGEY